MGDSGRPVRHVAVYGTLRRGMSLPEEPPGLGQLLDYEGPCVIDGDLYDLGDYPGLVQSGGRVVGELFAIADEAVLRLLDPYEQYDADDVAGSEYVRRAVRLKSPAVDAWVYFYNRDVEQTRLIAGGDWVRHCEEKGPAWRPSR